MGQIYSIFYAVVLYVCRPSTCFFLTFCRRLFLLSMTLSFINNTCFMSSWSIFVWSKSSLPSTISRCSFVSVLFFLGNISRRISYSQVWCFPVVWSCVWFSCVLFSFVMFRCVMIGCVLFRCVMFRCVMLRCVMFRSVTFSFVVFRVVMFSSAYTCTAFQALVPFLFFYDGSCGVARFL